MKKRFYNRMIGVLLVITLSSTLLAGCGSSDDTSAAQIETTTAEEAKDIAEAVQADPTAISDSR